MFVTTPSPAGFPRYCPGPSSSAKICSQPSMCGLISAAPMTSAPARIDVATTSALSIRRSMTRPPGSIMPRLSRQRRRQQLQRRPREDTHVERAVAVARLQRGRALHRSHHGQAGVAGGVAVAIAGGPAGAGLGQPPRGALQLAERARLEQLVCLLALTEPAPRLG